MEVVRRESDLVGAGCTRARSGSAAAAAETHLRTRAAGCVIAQRRAAGERRLSATLPPRPQEIADDHDDADLQHEAEPQGEATQAAQPPMTAPPAERPAPQEPSE